MKIIIHDGFREKFRESIPASSDPGGRADFQSAFHEVTRRIDEDLWRVLDVPSKDLGENEFRLMFGSIEVIAREIEPQVSLELVSIAETCLSELDGYLDD